LNLELHDNDPARSREIHDSRPDPRRPLILEIKGNSLDDGTGIRTVIFFKGCPLSCVWCHNPESKSAGPEISFDPGDCVACDACLEACEQGALNRSTPGFVDRGRCNLCYRCVEECPSGALERVGRWMEVSEVLAAVEKDLPFFRTSGGGVTLSGGEPTLFIDYTAELLAGLKEMGVHTLVETCGLFDLAEFEARVLPLVDAIYFDLKVIDPGRHRELCGAPNEPILENFRELHRRSLEGGPEVLPRVPLIPGMTDTGGNLAEVARFLRHNSAARVALLEYNPLWTEKSAKIGKSAPAGEAGQWTSWMERSEVARCRSAFDGFEIV
jgi:pyruvate formate lyase activating enzyme